MATKFTPRPPARSEVHLGTGTHCPLPLYQELRMAEGVAVHIPVLLTPGPLETQFPLSVKWGYSQKAVMSI